MPNEFDFSLGGYNLTNRFNTFKFESAISSFTAQPSTTGIYSQYIGSMPKESKPFGTKTMTVKPIIRTPRKYNPYELPDIDIPGAGFKRDRVSLIHVKRPNIFVIEHETTATIQVMDRDGTILFPMGIDAEDSAYETWYYNFLLQNVVEARQEVSQIRKLFGDAIEFHMFGSNPLVLQCSGELLNTDNYRWGDQWVFAYENFLKGTKCAENKARVFLAYDRVIVSGYMLNTIIVRQSMNNKSITMNFNMVVVDSMTADIPPIEEVEYNPESEGTVFNYYKP